MTMQQYADLWFKYQVWGMYIGLGIFGLYTLATIIRIVVILLSSKKEDDKE
jgi:hypothetical protein